MGLWLVVAPFLLGGAGVGATVNSVLVGLAVAALCLPRGKVLERYGTWDRWIFLRILNESEQAGV